MSTVSKARTFEGNSEAIEAWNGVLFDKFVRFRRIVCGGLAVIGTAALERHPPPHAARVLDIGCGFGDSTLEIARKVGRGGEVVGADAAERFVEVANAEAADAGIENVRFLAADVQYDALGGPYDYAFSRFGTMFFENPVSALRNVRRSLKDGAAITMTVWRRKDENPWLYAAEQAVAPIVPLPSSTDAPTCGPGPFSMASADLVSAQLLAAGFCDIAFERFDTSMRIGDGIADAIDFAMALGPAGEIIRLAGAEGERRRPQAIEALERTLRPLTRSDGVFSVASSWIVTARARADGAA
jgi:SAM-dependent methyltransferase